MAGAKVIKQILIERNMTAKQLADILGIEHQSMRNKLYRNHFSYEEIVKIADILNCDVKIITRDSSKEFIVAISEDTEAEQSPRSVLTC